MTEIAQPTPNDAQREITRIQRLFERSSDDKEDLISYARGVAALRAPAPAAPKPFGFYYWKSNGDGTESPDFCEGEVPSHVRVSRGLTPLYAAPTTSPEPDAVREALAEECRKCASYGAVSMSIYTAHSLLFRAADVLARPAHGGWQDIIEQCAKVADEMTVKWGNPNGSVYAQGMQDQGIRIASQIRALSRKDRGSEAS